MKYLWSVLAIVAMLGVNSVCAEETGKGAPVEKEIVVDSNEAGEDDEGYGAAGRHEMSEDETYDENTGLPNVVPSDKEGEIGW